MKGADVYLTVFVRPLQHYEQHFIFVEHAALFPTASLSFQHLHWEIIP